MAEQPLAKGHDEQLNASASGARQTHKCIYCASLPMSLTIQEYQRGLLINRVVTDYHEHPKLQLHILGVHVTTKYSITF